MKSGNVKKTRAWTNLWQDIQFHHLAHPVEHRHVVVEVAEDVLAVLGV